MDVFKDELIASSVSLVEAVILRALHPDTTAVHTNTFISLYSPEATPSFLMFYAEKWACDIEQLGVTWRPGFMYGIVHTTCMYMHLPALYLYLYWHDYVFHLSYIWSD